MNMKNKTSLVVFLQLVCLGVALAQEVAPEATSVEPAVTTGFRFTPRFNTNYSRDANPQANPIGSNIWVSPFENVAIPTSLFGIKGFRPNSYQIPFNSRFQSYDVNNMGNVDCIIKTDKILNELDEVQNITDVNSCFSKKKSWQRPQDGEKLSERQLLESDKEVCNCLRGKKNFTSLQAILDTDTPNLPNFNTTNSLGNFKRHLAIVKDKIANRHDMISLQASLIFNGNVRFASEYSEDLKPLETKEFKFMTGKLSIGQTNAQIRAEERSDLANQIKAELDKFKAHPHQPNLHLYSEKKYAAPPQQCVGFREFISHKTLPRFRTKGMFKDKFEPKDWDHVTLHNTYKTYMGLTPQLKKQHKDKIVELKKKILFLDTNPMIKNIISASQNLPAFMGDSSVPQVKRDEIKAKFTPAKLAEVQNKLYDMIKSYNQKDDNAGQYRNKLSAFFANDEIKELNGLMTEIDDKRDQSPLQTEEALLPPDMFRAENLTQKAMEEEFIRSTGLSSPDECTDGGVDITKCAETYAGYCRTIDTAVDTIRQMDDEPSVSNDLDSQLKDLLNPDIATNKAFKQFNEQMCNTKRRTAAQKNDEGAGVTFFEFKEKFCSTNGNPAECALSAPGDYDKLRKLYFADYTHGGTGKGRHSQLDTEVAEFNDTINTAPVTVIDSDDAKKIVSSSGGRDRDNSTFASMKSGDNLTPGLRDAFNTQTEKAVPFSGLAKGLSNLSSAMGGSSDGAAVEDGSQMNYSNTIMGGSQVPSQTSEAPKVENMPMTEREELLDDWKKEMAEWKANKNNADPAQSAVASANEASMKAKIEALEQLLAQQKKLTDDQYKLINDSIASQTRNAERSIASVEDDSGDDNRPVRRKGNNGIVGSNSEVGDETQRAPGSVPEQLNTSGSGGGSSLGGASSRSRTSGSNAISDSSRDSVAREEAKLVNLRENSNGSITVTASSSGSSAANAIVVPVNDALYLSAQSNPNGFSLSQIEQSIPKEQIAKLQDKGNFFILLLQNGTNPPLEVKVRKGADNKLVQVEGAPIVSRRVSLDSLRNTLPSPVPFKR